MASVDHVFRNGFIVDGTGATGYVGDVAVKGDKILAVGLNLPMKGAQEHDITGLTITPGFVDVHTHFDGQVTWDPLLAPSTGQGVTTLIMGNCGVGFAPCQSNRHDFLINLVEAIEDVPGTALHEGLKWEWETFEEYMDALSRKQYACDVGAMVGHAAVRAWVLGEQASLSDRPGGSIQNPIPQAKIEAMHEVVRDAVAKGAMGFSTSRAIYHRDMSGVLMPGTLASADEMQSLCGAIKEGGGGVFGANMDFVTFDDASANSTQDFAAKQKKHWTSEWAWLDKVASETAGDVGITFEVAPANDASEKVHLKRMKKVEELAARHASKGFRIRGQCHVRPQGFLQSFNSRLNLLLLSKTFRTMSQEFLPDEGKSSAAMTDAIRNASIHEFLARLHNAEVRKIIVNEAQERFDSIMDSRLSMKDPMAGLVSTLDPSLVFEWTPGCEPSPDTSVASLSREAGLPVLEIYYDLLVPKDGDNLSYGVCWKPLASYHGGDHEALRWMFEHPLVIPGVSDAGAHSTVFQDGTSPSHMVTHWARDRSRGPKLPIEHVIQKQCAETAHLFGLTDRGQLCAGLRADLNVFDFNDLKMEKPYVAYDLPTGASRWMQTVTGYRMTMVAGVATYQDGVHTGHLPGRFLRNPKSNISAWKGRAKEVAWSSEDAITARDGSGTTFDLKEHALTSAQGGGASAIGRIAREIESSEAKSKL